MFAGDAHDHVIRLRGTMRPFHGHGAIGVLHALRQLTCQGVERLIGWTAHGHYLVDAMFGRISKEIAAYIAENVTANVRQIEGVLNKILAYSDLMGVMDEEAIMKALEDVVKNSNEYIPTPEAIIEYIAKYFELEPETLQGQSRGRDVVNARQIAMYLIRRMTNMSLKDIGKSFGGRDHTTVLHSLDKVEAQMRSDTAFAETVKEITTNINAKQ